MQLRHLFLIVTFPLFQGCIPDSKNIGDTIATAGDSTLSGGDETTGDSTDSGPSSSAGDSDATDSGLTSSTGDSTDSGLTSSTGASDTTGDSATGDDTTSTTGDHADFDLFALNTSDGPCPPESDCDGFIQLFSNRMLRVEKFGELGNPVIEVEVSEEDYAAAVEVFDDPALLEILTSPMPMCNPPTDTLEQMELILAGQVFSQWTTACSLPPVDAARETANSLRMKYVP